MSYDEISYLEKYLQMVAPNVGGNTIALRSSVLTLGDKIDSYSESETNVQGLLFGNVQSGKTSQILGIISHLADQGDRLFVLLTTDNVSLQQQTLERALQNLDGFNVCDEQDYLRFQAGGLRKPTLLILKKNSSVLKTWNGNLQKSQYLNRSRVVVIDDEGDASSLNTKINKEQISTINSLITDLRSLTNSVYLQVTATPQSILLQETNSDWKPQFTHYFEPGPNYKGGEIFYGDNSLSLVLTADDEADQLLKSTNLPKGLRRAVCSFLVASAELRLSQNVSSNMLIHPSVRKLHHDKVAQKTKKFINDLLDEVSTGSTTAEQILREAWKELSSTYPEITKFDKLLPYIRQNAEGIKIAVVNSDTETINFGNTSNIVVGGNILGRGLTIPQLQTVYYCRQSKVPQADTVWQHSRIFGYDRKVGLCRIFLPPILRKLFRDLHYSNEAIIAGIRNDDLVKIPIHLPKGIKPTRLNVVKSSTLSTVAGGVNYFPLYPAQSDPRTIDEILEVTDRETTVPLTSVRTLLELQETEEEYDWDKESILAALGSLISTSSADERAVLIVRTERDIGRGTGTMLSPTDRKLGDSYSDKTVLTMYRFTGAREKEWQGSPFWVANIKLPSGKVFYSVIE